MFLNKHLTVIKITPIFDLTKKLKMIQTYVVTDLTRVNNQNVIVVASSEKRAKEIALKNYGIKNPSKITLI